MDQADHERQLSQSQNPRLSIAYRRLVWNTVRSDTARAAATWRAVQPSSERDTVSATLESFVARHVVVILVDCYCCIGHWSAAAHRRQRLHCHQASRSAGSVGPRECDVIYFGEEGKSEVTGGVGIDRTARLSAETLGPGGGHPDTQRCAGHPSTAHGRRQDPHRRGAAKALDV